jgi:hypothetical protein
MSEFGLNPVPSAENTACGGGGGALEVNERRTETWK